MKVLVTGGAGYIGSTICTALQKNGHIPIILDSLITGKKEFTEGFIFYEGDISDSEILKKIFREQKEIFCTIHCAALIVVPESVRNPFEYYKENVSKSVDLFKLLNQNGCKKIVFSSSASIYDSGIGLMVSETSPLKPNSPYARTKYMMEMVLEDYSLAYGLKSISLRYFNPIGSDPDFRTGIYAKNPTHVLGKLLEVANGKLSTFEITGTNWPTRDGSGIRDYIHVWDLANAHVKAVENFESVFNNWNQKNTYLPINLGTGKGITVKEFVGAFERVFGHSISKKDAPPRSGDVAGSFANADLAKSLLGWQATHSIEEAIQDTFTWSKKREKVLGYP